MSERIKGFISEVGKIDEEIKRLNAQKRKLHARKKDLERRILAFFTLENGITVVKHIKSIIKVLKNIYIYIHIWLKIDTTFFGGRRLKKIY